MSQKIYSSRSRIETFQSCMRKGYINFLWEGRGLVKRAASVYLSTGSYTHIGLEFLFNYVKNFNQQLPTETVIDDAVNFSLGKYNDEIKSRGFDLEEGEDKANNQYVIGEQCALVEAFIRAFASRVLPDILNRFKVIDVEREEVVEEGNLVIQARIDVILEEIATGDIYIVSFKTAANWDRRQEKANEHDNQGLSETWVLEYRLNQDNEVIYSAIQNLGSIIHISPKIETATTRYVEYLSKFKKNEKVMGVIMIYLMKGKRYESSSVPGRWEQHSPLIRAYRKLIGTEYEYAASLYYDNPSNKSGKGRLGKGWEPFNVWECEEVGYVKGWIKMLGEGKVQGDVIGDSFKIPAPYFRNQEHLDDWYEQARAIECEILTKQKELDSELSLLSSRTKLNITFPQTRKNCHYPVDCTYLSICYNTEVFNDPIGSGEYIYRTPHHKLEEEEHERLYQITNQKITKETSSTVSSGIIEVRVRQKTEEVEIVEEEEIVVE